MATLHLPDRHSSIIYLSYQLFALPLGTLPLPYSAAELLPHHAPTSEALAAKNV